MKKRSALQFLTILILILTSCSGNTATPISDEDIVATAVATMLSGLSTDVPVIEQTAVATIAVEPELIATSTPESQTLLPRSLYYLGQDTNERWQIYRIDRDGSVITQITFEADNILNYDVSPTDGTIVYPVQNSLVAVGANGEGRRVLAQNSNIYFSVIWSPDGSTIAYGNKDVVLYSLATGNSEVLIAGNDTETYSPASYSPNGNKLIIVRRFTDGPGTNQKFVYDFSTQLLTEITVKSCNSANIVWGESNTLFCNNYLSGGPSSPGLWQVNISDGSGGPMISSVSCPTCPPQPVAAPRQVSDGTLYFLYGEVNDRNNMIVPLLTLVHSTLDGITDREFVRPETFLPIATLWTPEDDALVIIQSEGTNNAYPKDMILVPLNPALPVVTIIAELPNMSPNSLIWGP